MSSYRLILERLVPRGRGNIDSTRTSVTNLNRPSGIGLDRTRQLLSQILNKAEINQLGRNAIHIVGTNGKGSVAWKSANMLLHNGLCKNVGMYTSPHLFSVRERIRLNGDMIKEDEFISLAE